MMKIFISYRRSDSADQAAALTAYLLDALPHAEVFRDVQSLAPATDWRTAILDAVQSADWLIALVGSGWLATEGGGGSRLSDRSDLVRIEVSAALRRGTPTLPVLIDGATMPAAERLPLDVAMLTRLQATRLSSSTFAADCAQIVRIVNAAHVASSRSPMAAGLVGMWTRTTETGGAFHEFFTDGTYTSMTVLQQSRSRGVYKFEYWEEGALDVGRDTLTFTPIRASASQSDPDNPHADYVDRPREIATRTVAFGLSADARRLDLIDRQGASQTFGREA